MREYWVGDELTVAAFDLVFLVSGRMFGVLASSIVVGREKLKTFAWVDENQSEMSHEFALWMEVRRSCCAGADNQVQNVTVVWLNCVGRWGPWLEYISLVGLLPD